MGELFELGWGKGNQGGGGEGFAPEVGETVGFAGGGVVGKVFVGFGGVSGGVERLALGELTYACFSEFGGLTEMVCV